MKEKNIMKTFFFFFTTYPTKKIQGKDIANKQFELQHDKSNKMSPHEETLGP